MGLGEMSIVAFNEGKSSFSPFRACRRLEGRHAALRIGSSPFSPISLDLVWIHDLKWIIERRVSSRSKGLAVA